jgi:hypothetical protein
MGSVLHHLGAVGWGWVGLFVALDTVAIGSAVVAATGRKPRRALWALVLGACTAFASLVATAAVATAGLGVAGAVETTNSDPSEKARGLAEGISVAMNGTAVGLLSTFLAGLATLVCLVAAVLYRSRSTSSPTANTGTP